MNEQIEESEKDDHALGAAQARLATRRLTLRAPRARDAEAIVPLANNMGIAQQTRRMPHPYSLRDAESWIAALRGPRPARETAFLIVRRNDRALMGAAGYAVTDEDGEDGEDGEVEIGYWLGEAYWGRGYATEAAQAVIDHAFAAGGLARIHGRCRVANPASRRILEKCGFQYAGSGMRFCRALMGAMPTEGFTLERFVWVSLKRWGAADPRAIGPGAIGPGAVS